MALTRGEPMGYDANRMTMRFTMLNNGVIVHCQISSTAMDALAHERGCSDRVKQFLQHRDEIERLASKLFHDKSPSADASIRIFAKHVLIGPDFAA
jgi:Protein of unknown function (DUF1488)